MGDVRLSDCNLRAIKDEEGHRASEGCVERAPQVIGINWSIEFQVEGTLL